jgi:hypothetical protein
MVKLVDLEKKKSRIIYIYKPHQILNKHKTKQKILNLGY